MQQRHNLAFGADRIDRQYPGAGRGGGDDAAVLREPPLLATHVHGEIYEVAGDQDDGQRECENRSVGGPHSDGGRRSSRGRGRAQQPQDQKQREERQSPNVDC